MGNNDQKKRTERRNLQTHVKAKAKVKKLRRHPAYTVAALQKKNNVELVMIAKLLAIDYRSATGEKKEALGRLIVFISGLVGER